MAHEEALVLTIPKCEKKKKLSGRTEFYNLMVTNNMIIGAKTGGSFFATRGLAGAIVGGIAKSRQDVDKFSGKDLEQIISSDKNNFAIPFNGFEEIKVSKQLGQPYIRFKLSKEGKKLEHSSSVPDVLTFDKQYLEELQTTLKKLAGAVVKT
ncbi:MAG: hypothetical protein WCD80_11540 [Desulfobaccales bacterium]